MRLLVWLNARFGKTHFCQWDRWSVNMGWWQGWYECTISNPYSDGKRNVVRYDGSTKMVSPGLMSELGTNSSLGDAVLVYWYDAYATKGVHAGIHMNGKIWVEFTDGEDAGYTQWTNPERVHKFKAV